MENHAKHRGMDHSAEELEKAALVHPTVLVMSEVLLHLIVESNSVLSSPHDRARADKQQICFSEEIGKDNKRKKAVECKNVRGIDQLPVKLGHF